MKHLARAPFLLYALLFLFSLQLLAEFIAAVYAFGLMGTGIPPEIVAVAFLFAPLLWLLRKQGISPRGLWLLAALFLLCRLALPLLDTRGRMLIGGVGVAAFLLFLPAWLHHLAAGGRGDAHSRAAVDLGSGLILAAAFSALLRGLGSGSDLSLGGAGQIIAWPLAALLLLPGQLWPRGGGAAAAPGKQGRPLAASVGFMALFTLLYFLFSAPHVLARYTGVDLLPILAFYFVAVTAAARFSAHLRFLARFTPRLLLAANLLFVLALTLTAWLHQTPLPAAAAAYPLPAAAAGWPATLALGLTLLLWPVLLFDAMHLAGSLLAARPSLRQIGIGFSAGAFWLTLLIFAHIFTTVYDYIPVVGPLFRDAFWLVHLAAGGMLLLALAATRAAVASLPAPATLARLCAGCGILALALIPFLAARPPAAPARDRLTVLTYNVQQGYDAAGQWNTAGQLALMAALDPDIIGLQETDGARIANGNVDIVRYFADRLDMHSYYGPKSVTGTFGIALLSKYPIEHPRTYFLFSEGEQVAVIEAEILVGDTRFTLFVNHLGNGGPPIQQEQFLTLIKDQAHVIALGDWNFRPTTPQYANMLALLNDSWTQRWPDWVDDQGQNPGQRKIDHIFLSPELRTLDARFLDSPASDHPAVAATLTW